jgi:drug/metabolite transporter (DMT)-like permease
LAVNSNNPVNVFKGPLWLLYTILVVHQIINAAAFPVAKIGLAQFDPLVYAFFRFLFCTLGYLPFLILNGNKTAIARGDRLKIFGIGLLLIPFNQVLFLVGQKLTSAGHASLLFATTPVFVYVLAIRFLKERLIFLRSLGIFIALGGVAIILFSGRIRFGQEFLVGDLLVLLAVMAWAGATVAGKPLASRYGAFRVMGTAMVYGSLVYMPFGFIFALHSDYQGVNHIGWLSILYMAVVVSIFGYVVWYWVLKFLEASQVAVLQNIQPVIATALAAVFLGEPVTLTLIVGGIIVIAGVILSQLRPGVFRWLFVDKANVAAKGEVKC